ncbi:MAG: tetratricopeptide repeat protein [Desulfobacteraceae bacterium]|nr:tetratricopeptide repeat protein [Desulfobacteraceae bacterium]
MECSVPACRGNGARRPSAFGKVKLGLLIFHLLASAAPILQAGPSHGAETPIGRIVSPQGAVGVLPPGTDSWKEAVHGQDLFPGSSVKTGQSSRVSILCMDETQLKLNENTVVVLKSGVPSRRLGLAAAVAGKETDRSLYEVPIGEIWLRNKNEKVRFDVQTPAVTAAIRGTEFNLKVAGSGTTALVLLEGKVHLANQQGQIDLDPGEEGMASVGQAPTKRVLVQPDDAVQWSLYYAGVFSYRDIPLGVRTVESSDAPGLQGALSAYNAGDLNGSERAAEQILAGNPDSASARIVLGWICLQRQDPEKALPHFNKALEQNVWRDLATSGMALSLYRTGDAVGAYNLMASELSRNPPTPFTLVMSGYFSMLVGKVEEAKRLLSDSRITGREAAVAHALLGQIHLVQNRKEEAAREAALALGAQPDSPLAQMSSALTKIAQFELPAARAHLEKAVASDPQFVEAYVYLARIWLGAEDLDKAWAVIGKALQIAPNESEVLSLAGFVRLGYRDFDKASKLFDRAVKANPAFGEPHLGLANLAFKDRDSARGLAEMLTATLLEPRVSLYQSSLGKALYQTRAFDKAMEVYDYAKTLDRNDPTPYLYKGIALADLYRPGEAIQEINKSIELNDNTAIFRSRLVLDRDLAVRNTSLARAFSQLGMGDWAYSKALTAVKNDPLNSSAHLFLFSAFSSTRQRVGAAGSELLLYRLLSPANANSFNLYSDYTPMFEMPYGRIQTSMEFGSWSNHIAPYQNHSIEAIGGLPGMAADIYGGYESDPGMRKENGDKDFIYGFLQGKYEPTVKDSLYAMLTSSRTTYGDNTNLNDFLYVNDKNTRSSVRNNSAEAGYIHRFAPWSVLVGYFTYGHQNWERRQHYSSTSTFYFDWDPEHLYPIYDDLRGYAFRHTYTDYHNIQLQQHFMLGDHTLIAGFDYFSGTLDYFYQDSGTEHFYSDFFDVRFPYDLLSKYNSPDRSYSFYVRDYWHITPKLLAELGISGDITDNSRSGFANSISSSTANPLVGLNYDLDKANTLRLAYQSYVNNHALLSPVISPSEVAGFPSQINADNGSQVQELGFSWETQWNPLTFTVLRLNAHKIDNPQYNVFSTNDQEITMRTERFLGSMSINRLLTPTIGIAAGVSGKVISMDSPVFSFLSGDFYEIDTAAGLSYMHPSGWFAGIKYTLVHQNLSGLSDSTLQFKQSQYDDIINLVDLRVGKYFDNKRGHISLSVTNLFKQRFFYQTEPVALNAFYPDRLVMMQVGLNF